MAFRDQHGPGPVSVDPIVRYLEIYGALKDTGGWFQDSVAMRFAAVVLLGTEGDASTLAATVRRYDQQMSDRLGWFSNVGQSIRLVLAANLLKTGDDPDAFLTEVERVRDLFRRERIPRGYAYEVLGVLVLRRVLRRAIEQSDVARMHAIYRRLEQDHWFLTGADDYPACAMLVTARGSADEIGAGVEAVYQALRRRSKLWRGQALQTAANVLYLTGLRPDEIAGRFEELRAGFQRAGQRIGQQEYDELAVLCFLAQPVERVVDTVMQYREALRAKETFLFRAAAFSLASSFAFVRLVGSDAKLGPLAEAKLLLDMQAIVVAREASGAAAS